MEIRKATIEDAAAIARNVLAAMEYDVYVPSSGKPTSHNGMASRTGEVMTYPLETLDTETRIMLDGMTEICRREDTLYSWRNTLVACIDGEVIGSLTSYDGAEYLPLRELTFGLAHEKFGWQPPLMDDETQAGEWYLDSLAVHPSHRRKGIAQLLVTRTLEIAEALGFTQASLIALADAPRLLAFYESLGFHPAGPRRCFGHDYLRMLISI